MAQAHVMPEDVGQTVVFGCGALAKLFGVASRTVARWIDEGRMKGYRLPGSTDRRVTAAGLLEFIDGAGWPAEFREKAERLIEWTQGKKL